MSEIQSEAIPRSDHLAVDDIRARVADTTINDITLLSTDYCNHLNELVMLVGMIGDMPDLLEEAREWQPKSYAAHFADSNLSIGPLATEAYEACEPEFRIAFDNAVTCFNEKASGGLDELEMVIASDDTDYISYSANSLSKDLQAIIDRIGGIVHGEISADDEDDGSGVMSQDEIDAMF